MKRSSVVVSLLVTVSVALCAVSTGAVADSPVKGSMLVAANGARLAPVYRVGPDGSAQIIIEGKLVTVPASTLSMSGGKLTTSLTKNEVLALH
ncbi:MAG: hypothetical protein JWN85_4624 [Gammaproteobacteria bacterium]|nr:hypothetical protein [Gammaproteobacteria bacterium]